ncbi:MAG: hypothetical protein IPG57_16220 [Burkholderiales bacterium]|nr:hypothetical protein [Burkholderiales bacterium]
MHTAAKESKPSALRLVAQRMRPGASAEAVFVVEYGPLGERINGHRVISSSEFEAAARQHRLACPV